MLLIELLKAVFFGILEGITEWLPISSTGHLLLLDRLIRLDGSDGFRELFFIVIQLGAVLAVLCRFWRRVCPFSRREGRLRPDKSVCRMWGLTLLACIPGGIAALLLDDIADTYLHTPRVIAAALLVYGIAFLVIERRRGTRPPRIGSVDDLNPKTALCIGLFQVLSIIPGTSRSGATIVGALLLGVSRVAAAEFTFFLALPVMLGMSCLKLFKCGFAVSGSEVLILLCGSLVAFLVSLVVIRHLMDYVRRHSFAAFGRYRILLGILVLLFCGSPVAA